MHSISVARIRASPARQQRAVCERAGKAMPCRATSSDEDAARALYEATTKGAYAERTTENDGQLRQIGEALPAAHSPFAVPAVGEEADAASSKKLGHSRGLGFGRGIADAVARLFRASDAVSEVFKGAPSRCVVSHMHDLAISSAPAKQRPMTTNRAHSERSLTTSNADSRRISPMASTC